MWLCTQTSETKNRDVTLFFNLTFLLGCLNVNKWHFLKFKYIYVATFENSWQIQKIANCGRHAELTKILLILPLKYLPNYTCHYLHSIIPGVQAIIYPWITAVVAFSLRPVIMWKLKSDRIMSPLLETHQWLPGFLWSGCYSSLTSSLVKPSYPGIYCSSSK